MHFLQKLEWQWFIHKVTKIVKNEKRDVKLGLDMTFAILQILWWKMKYGIKSYKSSDKYWLISIFKNKFLYNIRNYITYILWKTWRQTWPWFLKKNAILQIRKFTCESDPHLCIIPRICRLYTRCYMLETNQDLIFRFNIQN